ncbi:MAG: 4-hydroxy-3-methylbut-2-enyl diphosphate reductase, partial [Patescibacteria group bacterium]
PKDGKIFCVKIIRAKHAGFCFGVRRAYDLALQPRGNAVRTLGELIHNPEVLEELSSRGVRSVSAISRISGGTVIIRAHGISRKKLQALRYKKSKVIDASCPFVQKIHLEVAKFAERGIPVVIVGRRNHPEMRAVVEDFPEVLVVSLISDRRLRRYAGKQVAVLAQTTETPERFSAIVKELQKLKAKVAALKTICGATIERQTAAVDLAHKVDRMLVIGGKKSNNTKQLFDLVRKIVPSHWVENEKEIRKNWLRGVKKVGITAGASTPENTIRKVEDRIGKFSAKQVPFQPSPRSDVMSGGLRRTGKGHLLLR